jgi:hypothetical protein
LFAFVTASIIEPDDASRDAEDMDAASLVDDSPNRVTTDDDLR